MNLIIYLLPILLLLSSNKMEAQGCLDIHIKDGKKKIAIHEYEKAIYTFYEGLKCSKNSANYILKEKKHQFLVQL